MSYELRFDRGAATCFKRVDPGTQRPSGNLNVWKQVSLAAWEDDSSGDTKVRAWGPLGGLIATVTNSESACPPGSLTDPADHENSNYCIYLGESYTYGRVALLNEDSVSQHDNLDIAWFNGP